MDFSKGTVILRHVTALSDEEFDRVIDLVHKYGQY